MICVLLILGFFTLIFQVCSHHDNSFENGTAYNTTEKLYNISNSSLQQNDVYSGKSPSPFGIATGIFFVIIINICQNIKQKHGKTKLIVYWPTSINAKKVFTTMSTTLFLILLPTFFMIFVICYLYKLFVHKIHVIHNKKYKGMMSGADALWSVKDKTSSAIINILAVVEENDRENFIRKLKISLSDLAKSHTSFAKIFYLRSYWLGYNYWESQKSYSFDDYVRPIDDYGRTGYISRDEMHIKISKVCNAPLPLNDRALWEMLYFETPLNEGRGNLYPILFRVHHSLGDGLSLLNLLKIIFTDGQMDISRELNKFVHYGPALEPKNKLSFSEITSTICNTIRAYHRVPETLLQQVLRPPDINLLHPAKLSGEKIVASITEQESECLLMKIKALKKKLPNVKFSDFILTAVTASIQNHLCAVNDLRKNSIIPATATAVVTARVPCHRGGGSDLENNFSVAMATLPISRRENGVKKFYGTFLRLTEVKKSNEKLKNSMDFQVNYFIMSTVASFLPEPMLRSVVYSDKATLVLSNIPGPEDGNIHLCGNNLLKELMFFVPNRGTTGIGLSFFSYGGKLHLGITADRAAVNTYRKAKHILEGIINEIMHIDVIMSAKQAMDSHRKSVRDFNYSSAN